MKSSWYGLAACLLLAILTYRTRADEPLVDLRAPPAPAACDADSCVAVPQIGDRGVIRRPVASAVARAGTAPIRAVRRVADRIQRRPLLRRLFPRRSQVGGWRR
jgi:hypothetical protein